MKLDSRKLRLIFISSIAICITAFIAICFLGLAVLATKSGSLVSLKAQSQTSNAQLSNLEESKKEIEKYAYFKNVAKTVIPTDKNQAEAVLEIFQIANASGIAIQSITFPASTLGLSTALAQQDATSASSTRSAITQAKPVSGIPGLYSLELTITPQSGTTAAPAQQITYPKMLAFLKGIENNRRTAQITQVDIQPADNNQSLSFTLTVNIFIKP